MHGKRLSLCLALLLSGEEITVQIQYLYFPQELPKRVSLTMRFSKSPLWLVSLLLLHPVLRLDSSLCKDDNGKMQSGLIEWKFSKSAPFLEWKHFLKVKVTSLYWLWKASFQEWRDSGSPRDFHKRNRGMIIFLLGLQGLSCYVALQLHSLTLSSLYCISIKT